MFGTAPSNESCGGNALNSGRKSEGLTTASIAENVDVPGVKIAAGKAAAAKSAKALSKDRDMGSALRSIYQHTIDEKIPDEMLLLLGKLD